MATIAIPRIESATGEPLSELDSDDVTHRVHAYCSISEGGWVVYDLAAAALRKTGAFETVTPWSLNWGNLLNGNVTVKNVAHFTRDKREHFAQLIAEVPDDTDLADMDSDEVDAVARLCSFGYDGVWAAKTTKVAALYRPRAVPVLDGQIALALGFARNEFATRAASGAKWKRAGKIGNTVRGLQRALQSNASALSAIRARLASVNPATEILSDVRLLDIILWTSQDARGRAARGRRDPWVPKLDAELTTLHDVAAVSIPAPDTTER